MNKLASTLHDATHQVPGVPAHGENQPHRQPSGRHDHHRTAQRNQRPPRILVAWQNWIARHVGRG